MDKVIYIVKSQLHIYPPCIAQIRMLKRSGVDVEVWFGSCSEPLIELLNSERIRTIEIGENRGKYPGKLDKVNNWISFGNAVKRRIKSIGDISQIVFWFGTAETAIPLVGKLKGVNYALTSLELPDDDRFKREMFGKLTADARFIVCCETTRAYIMRYWYHLKKLPYVMPNKPYDFDQKRRKEPSIEASRKAIESIKDKKFIIYQGILKSRKYMVTMAKAIRDSGSNYYFVLMGQDPEKIYPEVAKEYNNTLFIENIPAPFHLEVTSYADIGFVFYDEKSSLNRAFCAPNKIYEYSGLGIPSIGNDVPGLVNTIGASGAGICCKIKRSVLVDSIKRIEENYDEYSKKAYEFYSNTDNESLMKVIIRENGLININ